MKKKKSVIVSIVFGAVLAATPAMAGINLGFSLNNGGISNFFLSAGDYYQAPPREVVVVQREVPEDEAPVVFYLARRAHCSPDRIVRMRRRGFTWWRITMALRLNPNIYYVPVDEERIGPPYGRAYGFYRHHGPRYLSDPDIVNMVNLRFMSSYYGVPPREIIERRERGESFAVIQRDYQGRGRHHGWRDEDHEGDGHGHGEGNGHDEGHGHGWGHGHGRGDDD
ncbi:MAG: hypothetical protein M0Z61_04645 [Nitrospiraceae bacterium]|nr:hypothetical protein [Nitrospiraceae bacterium]